jgi:hypothetical protein
MSLGYGTGSNKISSTAFVKNLHTSDFKRYGWIIDCTAETITNFSLEFDTTGASSYSTNATNKTINIDNVTLWDVTDHPHFNIINTATLDGTLEMVLPKLPFVASQPLSITYKYAELNIFNEISAAGGTIPSTPSTGTYNFDTDTISSMGSWTRTAPDYAIGKFVYSSTTLAVDDDGDEVSNALTWSPPVYAPFSLPGTNFIFKRAATAPTSLGTTTFDDILTGWYDNIANVPSGTDPMWMSKGTTEKEITGSAPNIQVTLKTTWQNAVKVEGADGLQNASGTLYATAANYNTNPGFTTYTFSTGAFSGHGAGPAPWTTDTTTMTGLSTDTWYECSYNVVESSAGSGTGTPTFGTLTARTRDVPIVGTADPAVVVFNKDNDEYGPRRSTEITYKYSSHANVYYAGKSTLYRPWLSSTVSFFDGTTLVATLVFVHIVNYGERQTTAAYAGDEIRTYWDSITAENSSGLDKDDFTVKFLVPSGNVGAIEETEIFCSEGAADNGGLTTGILEYGGDFVSYEIEVTHDSSGAVSLHRAYIDGIGDTPPLK